MTGPDARGVRSPRPRSRQGRRVPRRPGSGEILRAPATSHESQRESLSVSKKTHGQGTHPSELRWRPAIHGQTSHEAEVDAQATVLTGTIDASGSAPGRRLPPAQQPQATSEPGHRGRCRRTQKPTRTPKRSNRRIRRGPVMRQLATFCEHGEDGGGGQAEYRHDDQLK